MEAELNKENTKDSEDGIPDILITGSGHFLDWTFPRPTLPDWHIPNWAIPQPTLPRVEISPTRHLPKWLFDYFPNWTFLQLDISLTRHFPEHIFTQLYICPLYTYYFQANISLTLNNLLLTGYFWQFNAENTSTFLLMSDKLQKK